LFWEANAGNEERLWTGHVETAPSDGFMKRALIDRLVRGLNCCMNHSIYVKCTLEKRNSVGFASSEEIMVTLLKIYFKLIPVWQNMNKSIYMKHLFAFFHQKNLIV